MSLTASNCLVSDAEVKTVVPVGTRDANAGNNGVSTQANRGTISLSLLKKIREHSMKIPCYGERANWKPRTLEDYGDGGAFPEIHIPQYPLEMGRNVASQGTQSLIPITCDAQGNVMYDSIVQYGRAPGSVVHSKPADIVGRHYEDEELRRPDSETLKKNIERTKKAVEQKLESKLVQTNCSRAPEGTVNQKTQLIRYTPSNQNPNFNSGSTQRLIKIVDKPVDPLEPPKFKAVKAVATTPAPPPVPILHSPPRKATKEEREAWFIPPSLSNWSNSKGFTVSLDKRLATEGRGGQETVISPNFARISAALDAAQATAREQISFRTAVRHQKLLLQREQEERKAREIAQLARLKRAGIRAEAEAMETPEEREVRLARDSIRDEYKRKLEDQQRMERMGSKAKANAKERMLQDRDISEKIALGQAVPRAQESLYDQRLFNQTGGLGHDFVNDEEYNPYDKPLFTHGREEALFKVSRQGEIYQPSFSVNDLKVDRFSRADRSRSEADDKAFTGSRQLGPVQFERDEQETKQQLKDARERERYIESQREHSKSSQRETDNPMDAMLNFMIDAKSGRREEPEEAHKRKSLGVMHAVAGSSGGVEDYRDSKRSKINFVGGSNNRDRRN
ncbi:SNW domain-containing protein 1-like [Schistocerca gregaria]|uniref:SNW domain-containing protein 1-like n=1 Tax=Schistocerca gregaria TaxID=7010 RepID=UPI00211F11FE|nr:SNW domain-containing protein 1-like [Schistocerca gregaria]XP_049847957.1 SNW domain-containing protein 1-like [Schistocerca gregaria]